MEVGKAKKEMSKLNVKIYDLVIDFEERTGLDVTSIDIRRDSYVGMRQSRLVRVELKVEI